MQSQTTPFFLELHKLPYRNQIEVACEILAFCTQPRNKTRIMQICNLSHPETKGQLKHLIEQGFLEECQGYYFITGYGKQFLQGLELILEMWHK